MLNISAYKFVPIDDPGALRETLHATAEPLALKGTVLVAEEGINLFVAGEAASIAQWLSHLKSDPRFHDLDAKESTSDSAPFKHLKVKVKREIIRMNQPAIRPASGRAPAVTPATLQRWLSQGHDDDGREVVMLDTRNAFEVDAGAFDNAVDWRLRKFSDFPAALAAHADALRDKTVVSYCTGGIRCEKAALVMRQHGLAHVWQLEGGILRYFEHTQGAPHWRGHCFVFDERERLDPSLSPSPAPASPFA